MWSGDVRAGVGPAETTTVTVPQENATILLAWQREWRNRLGGGGTRYDKGYFPLGVN